jgi:hypothetical protein
MIENPTVGDKVVPKYGKASGKGYVFECDIEAIGWNDLPADKRFGRIIAVHPNGGFDVHWAAGPRGLGHPLTRDGVTTEYHFWGDVSPYQPASP